MGFQHRHRGESASELLRRAEQAAEEDPAEHELAPGRQTLVMREAERDEPAGGERGAPTPAAAGAAGAPPRPGRDPGRPGVAARWRIGQAFGVDLSGVSIWSDGPATAARAHGAMPSGRIDREADGGDVDELAAPDHVADALAGPAEPLPDELRRRLEAMTGTDLSGVRLRTGSAAGRAAAALGARAFAIGNDIVFGAGRYQPASAEGLRLLAHEVAHTVQQAGAAPRLDGRLDVSRPGDAGEREADRFADAVMDRRAPAPGLTAAPAPGALVQGEWERGQHLPTQETSVPPGTTGRDIGEIQESGPPIRMHHFAGANRSARPVLLIGGMHGDERAGMEVVDILLDRLQAMTTPPPQDVYVIPILHPTNAARRPRGSRLYTAGDPGADHLPSGRSERRNALDPNRDYPDQGNARTGRDGRPRYEGSRALMRVIEQIQRTSGQAPRLVQVHGTVHTARERDPDHPGRRREYHDRAGISRDEQDVPDEVRDELRRQGRHQDLARMEEQARRGTAEDTALAQDMAQAMRDRGHGQSVRGNDGGRVEWGGGETRNSLGDWGSAAVSDEVQEGGATRRIERPAMSVITVETAGDEASVDLSGAAAEERRAELMTLADVIEELVLGTRPRRAPAPQAPPGAPPDRPRREVQRAGAGAGGRDDPEREDPERIHALAEAGLRGPSGALPHLDAIQRSFGHHDVTGVAAHVGGPAAEAASGMNALAYASGDRVAFARGPELHQAAHEAAHVVQQRGGVRLDAGVGRAGDPYERHADAVADVVVRGGSAEGLLDTMAHRGAQGGPAVQRLDSHDIVGNTMSATGDTRTGALDARSERRLYERLAELEGRDPAEAGRELDAMEPEARRAALREAVERFQGSEQGRALIGQDGEPGGLIADNAVERADGSPFYDPPASGRRSEYTAPRATYTPGEARLNDITMQAVANAWPQTILGRSMTEEQAYQVLERMVRGRGLPFDPAAVNVIGMRAFQGGAIHDNGEPQGRVFTRDNRFDDTMYILSSRDGRHVQQSRATVDPGGESDLEFQVAADQQWDYQGNARGTSAKYDRPMYGLSDPTDVRRGSYWRSHPEEVEAAAPRGGGGRLVRRPDGRTELDRDARGRARMVSAIHSGGRGRESGEQTGGDSTGCSVVEGPWFPGFNESLRRASGGDAVRFTYSLIDLRTYTQRELDQILDGVVPARPAAAAEAAPEAPRGTGDAPRMIDYESVPPEASAPRARP